MKIIVLQIKNELICAAFLRDKLEVLERFPAAMLQKALTKQVSACADDISVGSIFVGRVENVVPSIHAAFVRFSGEETGYLPFDNVPSGALFNREYRAKEPLKQGDLLAVQVERKKAGLKQTALTAAYSLSSKLSAVTYGTAGFAVSKKLDDSLRTGLRDELQTVFKTVDQTAFLEKELLHHALMIRTDAGTLYSCNTKEACTQITQDAVRLLLLSEEVRSKGRALCACSLLYQPDPLLQLEDTLLKMIRFLQRFGAQEKAEVVCEDPLLYEALTTRSFENEADRIRVKLYVSKEVSLDALMQISTQIDDLQKRIVWLKSGAFLVIDKTEAMTVIDVNSGKNIKKKEDDFLSLNLEACKEALRQMRLRDISGIIIIDFINMRHEASRTKLKHELKKWAVADLVRTQFVDFTKLGLAELTREKH